LLRTVQQLSAPPAYKTSWLIPFKTKLIPVAATDVAHFIIRNGVVSLTTLEDQHYTLDTPLDELETQVDPRQFFRANRQVLLARASVTALEPYYNSRMLVHVQPAAPESIIVPKPRVTELRHWVSGS
jgi:two-component system response regulator LytT